MILESGRKRQVTIRALTYHLYHFITNFKFHTPLCKYLWCIANSVLQLLKPPIIGCPYKGVFRNNCEMNYGKC